MDVLRYSATQAQTYLATQCTQKAACIPTLQTCLTNTNSCLSTVCSQYTALQATAASVGPEAACWLCVIEPSLLRCPQQTSLWSCIPTGSGWTAGFKVCNTTASFNYGRCCQWTVPAGVTCARFQLWGAGGGSGVGRCCGGSPFGSSGAYASVSIPVQAGWTYTLCAGCAFCCYPCGCAQSRLPGCPTWVTGCGLNNVCANGGQGRLSIWMQAFGKPVPCRLSGLLGVNGGASICCGGSYFCGPAGCSMCGEIPYVPGASYFGSTTNNSPVYGIRGMWPRACWDTGYCGYYIHPPIYGFESTSQCCWCWTSSSTCCGRVFSACCAYLQIPGAGGAPSMSKTTNYGLCGDMGRMGMVCVCYK